MINDLIYDQNITSITIFIIIIVDDEFILNSADIYTVTFSINSRVCTTVNSLQKYQINSSGLETLHKFSR